MLIHDAERTGRGPVIRSEAAGVADDERLHRMCVRCRIGIEVPSFRWADGVMS